MDTEPYALVTDGDADRTARSLSVLKSLSMGVLVATTADEAALVVDRWGPPALLLIDLALPGRPLGVVEAVCANGRSEVLAWTPGQDGPEFAGRQLAGGRVRILRETAPPGVVQAAIEEAAARLGVGDAVAASDDPPNPPADSPAEPLHNWINDLLRRARDVCPVPGVAVYARLAGSTQFRAAVTWTSEAPMPQSPTSLAQVFEWMLEEGRPLVVPDLSTAPLLDVPAAALRSSLRGLVAVPILGARREVLGTICVFDVQPFAITREQLASLEAIASGAAMADETPHETVTDADASAGGAPAPLDLPRDREARERPEPPPLLDRRRGEFAIAREAARAQRDEQRLSLVLFHVAREGAPGAEEAGADAPVRAAGGTLLRAIRQSDLAVHWGPQELLLGLPGVNAAKARAIAERVRAALQAGSGFHIAVSGGVAELLAGESPGDAVARSAGQLRLARDAGRNHLA